MRSIVVIGGGVAGMSVAHELVERSGHGVDLEVHVYERNPSIPGGKARSIPVLNSGKGGRKDLPGEHGFRFFPGFYRHLPDTMQRIPYGQERTVFDNLVAADRLELARTQKPPIVVASRFPHSLSDLVVDFESVFKVIFDGDLGLRPGELEFFAARIWQVLTSCEERRLAEYEKITWADYLQAAQHSEAYCQLLVAGLSRSLLANDPHRASARTVGNTDVQLILNILEPGQNADRLLNGPTSDVWLDPWLAYLRRRGVDYHFNADVRQIQIEQGRVTGVRVVTGNTESVVRGDDYVFAVPVEKMAHLLVHSHAAGNFQDPLQVDPRLAGIVALRNNIAWMNGIQFYLLRDVPIVRGHSLYVDSPWALTSISQAQFWPHEHLANHGDGTVHGILSVCISNWDTKGIVYGLPARGCTRQQIADEIWAQVQNAVNVGGQTVLRDSDRHSWFLDPDIRELEEGGVDYSDAEPLLINVEDSWRLRPEATTAIPNLFLASDYVRTNTDVACMEGANEAARCAVNQLLDACGSRAPRCDIWALHEPMLFAPFRAHDRRRFEQGLAWDGRI